MFACQHLVFGAWCFSGAWGLVLGVSVAAQPTLQNSNAPVTIRVDATQTKGPLRNIWRFFGCDEPNYATMKDGRKLLADLGKLRRQQVYFRAHNLLSSGDGTPALKWGSTDAYTENAAGDPVYNWKILDAIFDSYLERGVRPYAQIGFMPKALSVRPDPYQHDWRPGLNYNRIYTGWAHPPKDYTKWAELVYQWVRHCVERYGSDEVNSWYWQVWNEPNIGYWRGTPSEFHKLHDYAIDAVRRALPTARVGGPDTAGSGGRFMRDFLEHCLRGTNYATGQIGTPLDFISFHAKGAPIYTNGHVRMGIAAQLHTIDDGFRLIASYPELKEKPIVIGESDPEGCAACQGSQLGYRNGTMYSSYTAASFARKHELAERHGVNLEGALTWAFTFEDQPYFAGFRQLASCGLVLPVFNVFRMFGMMSGERVAVESSQTVSLDDFMRRGVRAEPDVSAFASSDSEQKQLAIMVWHYHDDDAAGADAAVELRMAGLPRSAKIAKLTHYRIDQKFSNAYARWQTMNSPVAPNERQYAQLEEASRLATIEAPRDVQMADGVTNVKFDLPRQGVSLLLLQWE